MRSSLLRYYRRFGSIEALEERLLLVGDVLVRMEFTDRSGEPASVLLEGDTFLFIVHIRDDRATAHGIFRAHLDFYYESDLIRTDGPIAHGSEFNAATLGDASTAGLIDDVGGIDSDQLAPSPPGAEQLLFSLPFRATAAGQLSFTADLADAPNRGVLLFDSTRPVPLSDIEFQGGSIEITGADIRIISPGNLQTAEAGGHDSFQIVLGLEPTHNVTIGLSSSDTTEGTVSPATVTFTPSNWNTPQTVTVRGQDDLLADGDLGYTIVTAPATSTDSRYNGKNPPDVAVTNLDNDLPGITVEPTSGQTTEAGGSTQFTIVLDSLPAANVTIGLTSSDTSEGTVSPGSVTFTPANWNSRQTITVTGQDDDVTDGDVAYVIETLAASSSDPAYNGLAIPDVLLTNVDNDRPGITVEPTSGQTTEAGGTTQFAIVLDSRPTANVTIGLTSSDTSEGTVSPGSVTFTPANWNSPQTVSVTGQNDDLVDGDVLYTVVTATAVSGDPNYQGQDPADVSITNQDNDTAGILLSGGGLLQTTEAGGTVVLDIALTSQPTHDVAIDLSPSDPTEGIVTPASVTFTTENWNLTQQISVAGQDDDIADGDVTYMLRTAPAHSSDPTYAGKQANSVSLTNLDDDQAGIVLTASPPLQTMESGGTIVVTVALLSQPAAAVTVNMSSSDTTEGTVQPAEVVFTQTDWNVAQTVTVRGVDDMDNDGDVSHTVRLTTRSADAEYDELESDDLQLVNLDDDVPGIVVTPLAGLTTSESGASGSFQVILATRPTADVTVRMESSDASEGTLSTESLVFTRSNWSVPQMVTVTGVDDEIVDGDVASSIAILPATSADQDYNALDPADISVTNIDNDLPEVIVSPTSGLQTTESGGTAAFEVVLPIQPTADVTIGIVSSDPSEVAVSPAEITFTLANWNVPRTITATGLDDAVTDGNVVVEIITSAAASSDPRYSGVDPANVTVTNVDDDVPGIKLVVRQGNTTTETGGAVGLEVSLATQPMPM